MKQPRKPLSPSRQWSLAQHRSRRAFAAWPTAVRGMVWMVLGGLLFSFLNAIARDLTLHLDVYQSQFLRYLFGLLFISSISRFGGFTSAIACMSIETAGLVLLWLMIAATMLAFRRHDRLAVWLLLPLLLCSPTGRREWSMCRSSSP